MKLDLNDRRLRLTGIAGLMVFIAVLLKNGGEQMGMKKHFMSSVVGPILFTFGWAIMAYSISPVPKLDMKCILAYLGSAGIVAAVLSMKMLKLSPAQKKPFGLLFIFSWIAVAISVGLQKSRKSKMLGMFALANVLGAMLVILPKARTLCVVDNPGIAMFASTFVSLALANAL